MFRAKVPNAAMLEVVRDTERAAPPNDMKGRFRRYRMVR